MWYKYSQNILWHSSDFEPAFDKTNSEGYWFSDNPEVSSVFGENTKQYSIDIGDKQANLDDLVLVIDIINSIPTPKEATLTKEEALEDPLQTIIEDWFWQTAILQEVKNRGYTSATFSDMSIIEGPNARNHQSTIVFDKSKISTPSIEEPEQIDVV
jgi:hypothetical protein